MTEIINDFVLTAVDRLYFILYFLCFLMMLT